MISPSSLILHPSSLKRQRAFTLIELLVVLSLIVLALAAAVPAFNYITGSRSTDSAQNIVASMLQRARAQAIQSDATIGVAFFVNPADNRATMALIATTSSQESPYYRGWTDFSYQQGTASVALQQLVTPNYTYVTDQSATALYMQDTVPPIPAGTNYTDPERYRTGARLFVHDATTPSNNPTPFLQSAVSTPVPPWAPAQYTVDFLADVPFETLPANIAVQTINDPKGITRDHYLQTGVILFDPQGRVISTPYAFRYNSQIYNLLAKPGTTVPLIPPSTNAATTLYSQLGVVIYDRSAFLNQPGATEGDPSYSSTGAFGGTDYLQLAGPTAATEGKEESWLDQNATPLFINRGNGTILKGQ